MLFDLGYSAHKARAARPGTRGTSLQEFFAAFPDESACLQHVFTARFGARHVCPACGMPVDWKVVKNRRMLIHRKCRTRIAAFARTLMDHARLPAQMWFYVMLHMANSAESVNAAFVQRHLGIDDRSAQRMLGRIRLHLAALDFQPVIGARGETLFARIERIRGAYVPSSTKHNVAQVMFIAERAKLHAIVIDPSRPHRLRALLFQRVHPAAKVATDCHQTWRRVISYGRRPSERFEWNPAHLAEQLATIDPVQSFLTSFRRGFRTQHQHVRTKHLWLYLSEYLFRYNRRGRSDEIFWDMVSAFPSLSLEVEDALRRAHCDVRQ